MTTTLFLQSEIPDPYRVYAAMLRENPVYWDSLKKVWAIYSYQDCKMLLTNPSFQIPAINQSNNEGINEFASLISSKLVRLSNGAQHEIARHVVMLLFSNIKALNINDILKNLGDTPQLDWVDSVARKLPVLAVLKGFGFEEEECDFISGKMEQLVKIMLPLKTPEQVRDINQVAGEIYGITEKHLLSSGIYKTIAGRIDDKYKMSQEEIKSLCISNLIGLLIQSYDAGRGILSNSLLSVLRDSKIVTDKNYFQKAVIETLRFDPPVHNTRRVATNDIVLDGISIKKGEALFIVLAAANRDPRKFINPQRYDTERTNNGDHLTFGIGGHMCPAKQLVVSLTTDVLLYLFGTYKKIQFAEKEIAYEPMINVRLPKNIFISLS